MTLSRPFPKTVTEHFDRLQFDRAIESVLEGVRAANKYIAETQPWALAKDETKAERLDTVLYTCVEALRCASILLDPVIPNKAQELREQLGLETLYYDLDKASSWGDTPADTQTKPSDPLFPRIDLEALLKEVVQEERMAEDGTKPESKHIEHKEIEHKDEVTIEDFGRLEFRVAEVVDVKPHPKADKLLVLSVKLGSEERTIVSGIREWYKPEELTGKKVVIVANLKPVKLRGVESQGMILAAEDETGLSVATLDRDIASGSEVR